MTKMNSTIKEENEAFYKKNKGAFTFQISDKIDQLTVPNEIKTIKIDRTC